MKELANEFKVKFKCLGENTEKYKAFPIKIEKEIKNMIIMVMRILQLFPKK